MPRRAAAALKVPPDTRLSRVRPPATLSPPEQKLWASLVAACTPNPFAESDVPLLCRYVEACALADEAACHLRSEGAVVDGKPSAWIIVQEKSVRAMVALALRLRLSPQARALRNPKVVPENAYERMRLLHDTAALADGE